MKRIGILGSGMVAKVLATGFIRHGFEVMIGSRESSKLADWQQANPQGKIGSFTETAAFGELIILSVKGTAAVKVCELAGAANLSGKTVIDTTNPIADAPPVNGVLQFFTGPNESLMEQLQAAFPSARFVKAFSCVGNAFMIQPDFNGQIPTMFICGNDDSSKKQVTNILTTLGWETEDMGKAEAARAIEPLCILWCIPGFLQNRWTHAFKLLKK